MRHCSGGHCKRSCQGRRHHHLRWRAGIHSGISERSAPWRRDGYAGKDQAAFRHSEVNEHRRRAVGSIKAVVKAEKDAAREAFWETAEIGKTYKGEVKSLTSYGAFVDLGGIDGMVHISELSWKRIKHPVKLLRLAM